MKVQIVVLEELEHAEAGLKYIGSVGMVLQVMLTTLLPPQMEMVVKVDE